MSIFLGILYIVFSFALLTAIKSQFVLFKIILMVLLPLLSLQWFSTGFATIVLGFCLSKVFGVDPKQPTYNQSLFARKYGYMADNIGFIIIIIGAIMIISKYF